MIAGIFHEGSGCGNQLFRYVASRVLAEDKGFQHGMYGKFKGAAFMDLKVEDAAKHSFIDGKFFNEKKVFERSTDIRSYDPLINFVEDNTVIDGEFQDPRYFEHRLVDIREWLKVLPLNIPDDLCVIGFRGGEYATNPALFLTKEYWDSAIKEMRDINPSMRFEVHTDDVPMAYSFFDGQFHCVHDMGTNWKAMRYARYAIIANSSFFILPRLLRGGYTIAPKYWARRNTQVWSMNQNYYKDFLHL